MLQCNVIAGLAMESHFMRIPDVIVLVLSK